MKTKKKPVIKKIKLTKEELEEVFKIMKGEPINRTRLAKNRVRGFKYEYTNRRPLSKEMVKRRIVQLFGSMCIGCGYNWPDYKVSINVGDSNQGAKKIERYCSECFDKIKDRLTK